MKPDFFGEDAEFVDHEDDLIIRSMEWLLLVPGQFVETCTYAIRIYKYLLSTLSFSFPFLSSFLHLFIRAKSIERKREKLSLLPADVLTCYRTDKVTRRPRLQRPGTWARHH
jgi:hypothetical protein